MAGKEYCTLHFNKLLRPAKAGSATNERDVYVSASPLAPTENEVEREGSESEDSDSEDEQSQGAEKLALIFFIAITTGKVLGRDVVSDHHGSKRLLSYVD